MRNKFILIRLLSLFLALMMVGCGTENEHKQGHVSKHITLDEVKEAFSEVGLELLPNDLPESAPFILNGEEPKSLIIGRFTAEPIFKEILSIYIFNSSEDQEAGRLELEEMNINEDKAIVYSFNNVILLYWFDTDGNQKVDSDIKNAIKLIIE